ncbi:hypothetical protein PENSTE_c022G05144 [Penicillium steckii]|uniref:Arrestin-like N-terminal domain-containing protein n=1 Tax=Penicillium steckii TaxID=303698 RepID=A0A1V6SSG7_9EURO|nr:hypothetical protein PENSTE_c022G05144 [Penicillium steckii]
MKIHLDSPNRGYLPGALVRGEVELGMDADTEQGTLSIVFSGRSKIELNAWSVGPGDYGRSTQFLVNTKTVFCNGTSCYTDMPAGGYPFLFTFPSRAQCALGQSIWSESMRYGHPKNWPHYTALDLLPRSLSYTGGSILSATIEYRLDAKWVSETRQERRSVVLPFDTYRSESVPLATPVAATDQFTFKNKQLEECQRYSWTLADRVHMALGSEGISTKTKFEIQTKIETVIVQGTVPSVELRVLHPLKKPAGDEIPVRLQFMTVHLERITSVRTPRRAASHANTVYFSTNDSLNVILPETTEIDISDCLGLSTHDIPYDLDTFNLRQTHRLGLYFIVECMGNRFEFQKKTDLAILSPFYEETPPSFTDI